jgi:hypothetical protein
MKAERRSPRWRSRMGPIAVSGFFAGILLAVPSPGEDLDAILGRHLEARGGRQALEAVGSVVMTGTLSMGLGREASLTIAARRPQQIRIEIELEGIRGVYAFDGEQGWTVMPFMGKTEPVAMSPQELGWIRELADFDGPLVALRDMGHSLELLGPGDFDGRRVHMLEITSSRGASSTLLLDAEDHLLVAEIARRPVEDREVVVDTTFGEYREVSGVLFPHFIESAVRDAPIRQSISIERIELDVDLPDSFFRMPKP